MTLLHSLPPAGLAQRRLERSPELRRTWLFGAGAHTSMHEAMGASGADVLIHDLEDYTPPKRVPSRPGSTSAGAKPARWCAFASTRSRASATST
jgi:hypothetical protein